MHVAMLEVTGAHLHMGPHTEIIVLTANACSAQRIVYRPPSASEHLCLMPEAQTARQMFRGVPP